MTDDAASPDGTLRQHRPDPATRRPRQPIREDLNMLEKCPERKAPGESLGEDA